MLYSPVRRQRLRNFHLGWQQRLEEMDFDEMIAESTLETEGLDAESPDGPDVPPVVASDELPTEPPVEDPATEAETISLDESVSAGEAVAEAVVAALAPIRSTYQQLNDEDVARIMRRGALDARTQAEGYQQMAREVTGLAAI